MSRVKSKYLKTDEFTYAIPDGCKGRVFPALVLNFGLLLFFFWYTNMNNRGIKSFIVCLMVMSILTGCGLTVREYETDMQEDHVARVVLEEDNSFYTSEYVREIPRGEDVSFTVHEVCGRHIEGTDYRGNYSIKEIGAGTKVLTFENVRYSTVISVHARQETCQITYYANGGRPLTGQNESVTVDVPHTHIGVNTKRADELFVRPGYTLLGWSPSPSGENLVGPGSRIAYRQHLDLYAIWVPWSPDDIFTYTESGEGLVLTGLGGQGSMAETETLVIPGEIAGKPVYGIAGDAFAELACRTVILPLGLRTVENGAFRDAELKEIYLFDDLVTLSGHAFDGCGSLQTMHIGAATPPVFSGNYFDTFADKYERLMEISDEPKIVLFSGSSARFGYDSAKIEEALGMQAVNMGVFAYANALPELLLIRECMKEDDILLISPEFDAAQSQFCVGRQMEYQMLAMCESDYDLIARINLKEVTNAAGAFDSFLKVRKDMETGDYDRAAADYDEDGHPISTPSYNEFGDYILFRPNAESEEPVYGLGVNYTSSALPKAQFIDPFNQAMGMFLEKGVKVFFTYSPRNILALSPESTEEARAELHTYLCENLCVPVISDLEESLYAGTYLYGTDNHLSTEGVRIRTERVIRDLAEVLK